MTEHPQVEHAVLRAVDVLNEQLPRDERLSRSCGEPLVGPDACLDSLALVNLVVLTEEVIEREFAVEVSLADEIMKPVEESPFRSLDALIQYVASLVNGQRALEDRART